MFHDIVLSIQILRKCDYGGGVLIFEGIIFLVHLRGVYAFCIKIGHSPAACVCMDGC